MFSNFIKNLGRGFGLEIRRHQPHLSFDLAHRSILRKLEIGLVLDVGANTGQFGKQLRSQYGYGGDIVSFEPSSSARAALQIAAGRDPRWKVMPYGLGASSDNLTLNISGNSQSSSLLNMLPAHVEAAPDSIYVSTEKVEIRSLDAVIGDLGGSGRNLLLKLDVQGYEKQVLDGAANTLKFVPAIRVEMSIIPLYQSEMLIEETLAWMRERGYMLHAMEPNFANPVNGGLMQVDGLFVKSTECGR